MLKLQTESECQMPNENEVLENVVESDSANESSDDLSGFTEAGTETNSTESDAKSDVKSEAKVEQKQDQTSAEKPAWDTERQRADQAEANYRKLQREKADIESKAIEAEKRIAEMESKIAEFAKANDVNLDEIESEFVDPMAYKVIKNLQSKLSGLEKLAENYQKEEQRRQQVERERQLETAKEQAKNQIISDIESEFGSQYRNEALKKADEICNKRGYAPQDRYEAAQILRQCYKELASKKTAPKQIVASDTGKTTTTAAPKEDVKPGTLREVIAQMRAKAKV